MWIFATLFLIVGLMLDCLNLRWAYTSARGIDRKSGIFFVPVIFYALAVALGKWDWILTSKLHLFVLMVFLHLVIYFFISAWVYRIFSKRS